jgi:hypothetical protein
LQEFRDRHPELLEQERQEAAERGLTLEEWRRRQGGEEPAAAGRGEALLGPGPRLVRGDPAGRPALRGAPQRDERGSGGVGLAGGAGARGAGRGRGSARAAR